MNGKFGKKMLGLTLRGSAAKQVLTARLNELSTYGLLKDMAQDELQLYIDALVAARCLRVKGGVYPTISTTEFGDRVMREQEQVALALPLHRAMAELESKYLESYTQRSPLFWSNFPLNPQAKF